jgi:hypothetical protein
VFLRWLFDLDRDRFNELLLLFVGVFKVITRSALAAISLPALT